MKRESFIIKELENTLNRFPKFQYRFNDKTKEVYLKGILDICDTVGEYWDSFEILVIISKKHPYDVPIVVETGKRIPFGKERHISNDGECCLDIPHKLIKMARKGIVLSDFMAEVVYPYFANQLYFEKEKKYASGEWQHQEDGIIEFYREELKIDSNEMAIHFLKSILDKNIPSRNDPCLCKKDKFKRCHGNAVNFLISMSEDKLKTDLELFQKKTYTH